MSLEIDIINRINEFVTECEQAQLRPNRIVIGSLYLNIAKKRFPNIFQNDFYISRRFGKIGVITTQEDYLGVGLLFDDIGLEEFKKVRGIC